MLVVGEAIEHAHEGRELKRRQLPKIAEQSLGFSQTLRQELFEVRGALAIGRRRHVAL